MTAGNGERVQSAGSFRLPLPPQDAFHLFTAEGERRWVPGWSPEILGELPQHPGLVFVTGMSGAQTIWTVLESDPAAMIHRYSRVTPEYSAGIVVVRLRASGSGCEVEVSYDLTALSPAGRQALAGYESKEFGAMLAKWQELIAATLSSDEHLPA